MSVEADLIREQIIDQRAWSFDRFGVDEKETFQPGENITVADETPQEPQKHSAKNFINGLVPNFDPEGRVIITPMGDEVIVGGK